MRLSISIFFYSFFLRCTDFLDVIERIDGARKRLAKRNALDSVRQVEHSVAVDLHVVHVLVCAGKRLARRNMEVAGNFVHLRHKQASEHE